MLDKKPLVWLGKLSFSIYLLHLLMVYLVCIPLFNVLLNLGTGYVFSVIIASTICILVTLLVSDLYSRYVDQFAIDVGNRLTKVILKK